MKKVIIITIIVCIIIGITVIFFLPKEAEKTLDTSSSLSVSEIETVETSSADEVFYVENPVLKLSNLNGHITDIYSQHDNYAIIMGYSEYPLIIRKDRGAHPKITVNSEGTEFTAYTKLDNKEVFYYSEGGEVIKGDTPFSYAENNTHIADLYTEDGRKAYSVYYGNIDKADIVSVYYYTVNEEGKYNIYRFDGTLKPVLEKDVTKFKVFSDREDFLYSDDEYLYLYDVSSGESKLLTGMTEESAYFKCDALTDFSEIYYCEWLYDWFWYSDTYPLYVIKQDGEKEILHEGVVDYIVKNDTLYYFTDKGEFYMRKNGKSEKLSTITHGYGSISEGNIIIDESGYFIVNIHSALEVSDDYFATDSYKSNFFLSTDGKDFVEIEKGLKQ